MTHLLSIDPGMSSGIALGTYSATEPYRRIQAWQPRGGLGGLLEWFNDHYIGSTWGWRFDDAPHYPVEIVAEKFVPLGNGGGGMTLASVEPLRIEGAMVALGFNPAWQRAAEMYFMAAPNDTLAQKKKKAQILLKRVGMWATGKAYGHSDGADVNSATLHALAYLRTRQHAPTIRMISPPQGCST